MQRRGGGGVQGRPWQARAFGGAPCWPRAAPRFAAAPPCRAPPPRPCPTPWPPRQGQAAGRRAGPCCYRQLPLHACTPVALALPPCRRPAALRHDACARSRGRGGEGRDGTWPWPTRPPAPCAPPRPSSPRGFRRRRAHKHKRLRYRKHSTRTAQAQHKARRTWARPAGGKVLSCVPGGGAGEGGGSTPARAFLRASLVLVSWRRRRHPAHVSHQARRSPPTTISPH